MIEINNVLKEDMAEGIRALFLELPFEDNTQTRPKPYEDNFHGMPNRGEEYSCKYKRSRSNVEKHWLFKQILRDYFHPVITKYFHNGSFNGMAYKMTSGDYFRTHDDLSNGVGYIYYLTKNWKWDWGGILTVLEPKPSSVLPKFNTMYIFEKKGVPHYITPVMDYALEPRLAIVGFINGDPIARA